MISSWRGFYGVMLVAVVTVLLYYAFITRPLARQEREVDARLAESIERLEDRGLGTTAEEVAAQMERIEQEIEVLQEMGRDSNRDIQFDPEVRNFLQRPFTVLDFDQRRYLVADRLFEDATERGVGLFGDFETELPTYRPEVDQPYMLWAQLTVIEQLVSTAIRAGVKRVDSINLVETRRDGERPYSNGSQWEIPVQMSLVGDMESLRAFLLSLPLTADDLREIDSEMASDEEKSAFYASRFIFRKASRERSEEISLDLMVSGFLNLNTTR